MIQGEVIDGKIIYKKEYYNKFGVFIDRKDAGIKLAKFLYDKIEGNEIVYAIPSGGIPVAKYFCKELNLKLKILLATKILLPWNSEVGYGAITIENDVELNYELIKYFGLSKETIEEGINKAKNKLIKVKSIIEEKYLIQEKNKSCIIVDDGLASGYTMLVAVKMAKRFNEKIYVAVPTASMHAVNLVSKHCDKVFVLNLRNIYPFAVADAYEYWYDLSEEDVINELKDC